MRNELTPEPACLPYLRQPIVVGLSGGRDSVALLLLLARHGCTVRACHIHHGIRGKEADADAEFCAHLCSQWNIPFQCQRIDAPALAAQQGQSLETAARLARRQILASAAIRAGGHVVALAHHADDQAETILFRLARGAAGMRGMLPVHRAEGITWIRPLLGCTRRQITSWLEESHEPWRDDATNAIPDVARNRIRLEVLPALNHALGRDVAPILNRSARLQAETLEALDTALSALPLEDPQGRLYLPTLLPQPAAFRKAVLHRYLTRHGIQGVNEAMVMAVDAILPPEAKASRLCLPGGKRAVRRQKRLFIEP